MIGCMGGNIFVLGFKVLTLDVGSIADFQSGLSEGIAIEVFRFYGVDIPSVAWNFRYAFLLVDWLKLLIYLFRKVTK